MVLADTLALAARDKPALLLDFATLTGACVNALTERYSGAFTNRAGTRRRRCRPPAATAASASGASRWTRTSTPTSRARSPTSCSARVEGKGDHILAARFLSRFVPDDIALGARRPRRRATRKGGLAHVPTEFTGFGVRFATHLLGDGALLDRLERPAQ